MLATFIDIPLSKALISTKGRTFCIAHHDVNSEEKGAEYAYRVA